MLIFLSMIFLELKINKDTFLPVTARPTSKLTDTENKLMLLGLRTELGASVGLEWGESVSLGLRALPT